MRKRRRSWWPAALGIVVAACTLAFFLHPASVTRASAKRHRPVAVAKPAPTETYFNAVADNWYNGVAVAKLPDLAKFTSTTGEHPAIIAIYVNLSTAFPITEIKTVIADGALPLIQVNPRQVTLASLLHGTYDTALAQDEAEIASLGRPVAISFGHEMNGTWYSWGCRSVTPGLFRSAYRYVWTHIRAPHVIWVWDPNKVGAGVCTLRDWYPGSQYVTWVGIDGYLRVSALRYASTFGRTLAELKHIAPGKPILFAESGVAATRAYIPLLRAIYDGARAAHVIGVVWFDSVTSKGDYRPYTQPAFLSVFKSLIRQT